MALISKYSLNGNANDLVWSNNWTALNVTWVDGKMNWWASFNGGSTSIRATGISLPTGSSPYFIWWWFKLLSEIWSWTKTLFNLNPDATLQDTIYVLDYEYNWWTRRLNYQHYYNWPETYYTLTYNIALWTSVYHYIWINYTGSSMELYVDWLLVTSWWWSWTYWSNWPVTYNSWFTMWATYALSVFGSYLDSIIDEVEVHNTSLNASEIKNKYLYYNGFYNV